MPGRRDGRISCTGRASLQIKMITSTVPENEIPLQLSESASTLGRWFSRYQAGEFAYCRLGHQTRKIASCTNAGTEDIDSDIRRQWAAAHMRVFASFSLITSAVCVDGEMTSASIEQTLVTLKLAYLVKSSSAST